MTKPQQPKLDARNTSRQMIGWNISLFVTLATAPGCSSSGISSSGVTVDQACADIAQAQCSRRQACSSGALTGTAINPAGAFILSGYGDMTTCLERVKIACTNNVAAMGTNSTPDQLEKCASGYSTWACIDLFDNNANPPPDCAPAGQLANGATCALAGQCASRFCAGTKNATCGVCADQPADGAPCDSSGCAPGQECRTESAGDMLCRDRLATGDATCTSDLPCQTFSTCVGANAANPTQTGVCTASAAAAGAPCGATSNACDSTIGLTCLGPVGAKTCQPIAYVQAGQTCGTLADGSRAECTISDCFTATAPAAITDTGATCVARAADGATCDTQVGPLCLTPARCVLTGSGATTGKCVVPAASLCP